MLSWPFPPPYQVRTKIHTTLVQKQNKKKGKREKKKQLPTDEESMNKYFIIFKTKKCSSIQTYYWLHILIWLFSICIQYLGDWEAQD